MHLHAGTEDAQVPDETPRPPARIINAAGYLTRLGNSIMDPPVLRAMEEASRSFVELDKAQLAASDVIAAITGAEAGYVVGGAAAGLALAAAATPAPTATAHTTPPTPPPPPPPPPPTKKGGQSKKI